jgi:uridine phosphorylase
MKAYHLDLEADALRDATIAILPGDPFRVPRIARALDPRAIELAHHREYRSMLARVGSTHLVVTATGIGGPSTAIALEELAGLGIRSFLRVGTTGAIQEGIVVGDLIVAAGAVRLDGASRHYAPLEFPALADHRWVARLERAAREMGATPHVGVVISSDTFYPGQERYDSFSGYVPRAFQGATAEWVQLGCLSYEMESATLFTVARSMGLTAGCVLGVILNRGDSEQVDPEVVRATEERAIACAAAAARAWIGAS